MSQIPTEAERKLFNDAFLGYKFGDGELLIRVCSACPGKEMVERWAHSYPACACTHGLCVPHFNEQMAALMGENNCPETQERCCKVPA